MSHNYMPITVCFLTIPPRCSKAARNLENLTGGALDLTPEERAEIDKIVNSFEVKGDRYAGGPEQSMLWG